MNNRVCGKPKIGSVSGIFSSLSRFSVAFAKLLDHLSTRIAVNKWSAKYASKVESQCVKFHTNLIIMCISFPRGSWLVDRCYLVMQFLAETTKTKQIHTNSVLKPQFFNETEPWQFRTENYSYFKNQKSILHTPKQNEQSVLCRWRCQMLEQVETWPGLVMCWRNVILTCLMSFSLKTQARDHHRTLLSCFVS